jgi:hypothetical protein
MMIWMPTAKFPSPEKVLSNIIYGYNGEFTGILNISTQNIVQILNAEISIKKDISSTPPSPSNGEIDYVS